MTLYDLVKESCFNPYAMEELILRFEPKIKKSLYMSNPNEREDLSQELKIKLIQYISGYNMDSIPGFWNMKDEITRKIKI